MQFNVAAKYSKKVISRLFLGNELGVLQVFLSKKPSKLRRIESKDDGEAGTAAARGVFVGA